MPASTWWKRMIFGALCAATTAIGSSLTAQEDILIPGGPRDYTVLPLRLTQSQRPSDFVIALANDDGSSEESPKSDYWLGVQIATLPEVARQQLGVDGGLAVEEVMPDSPAAKAEIKKFDILVKVDDAPLKEPSDLIKAIDASQGKEITIMIIRGGKDRAIKVLATKRPERERIDIRAPRPELAGEIKRLEEALESLKNKAGKDGMGGFWFARPAVVAPRIETKVAPFPKDFRGEFPKDLAVQINKQGDQPTKIHVKRGDKDWDVTEDKLGDLPDDIRPHVQALLGRMLVPGMAAAAKRIVRVTPEGKVEGELKIAPQPPMPPKPPAAPRAPAAPQARTFNYRLGSDDSSDSKLDALMNEVKQLRKEVEELRSKK